jgi:hypothetical protein
LASRKRRPLPQRDLCANPGDHCPLQGKGPGQVRRLAAVAPGLSGGRETLAPATSKVWTASSSGSERLKGCGGLASIARSAALAFALGIAIEAIDQPHNQRNNPVELGPDGRRASRNMKSERTRTQPQTKTSKMSPIHPQKIAPASLIAQTH